MEITGQEPRSLNQLLVLLLLRFKYFLRLQSLQLARSLQDFGGLPSKGERMSYTIEQVSQLFEATLVPQHQKQAQETLLAAAHQPGFFQILLQVRQLLCT